MARKEAFHKDVTYFLGDDWESRVGEKPKPLREYEQHLQTLGREAPVLLLAHSFTQHLGMTAGGQIVRGLARKHMNLPEDKGTAAFEFQVPSINKLKETYKQQLNALGKTLPEETRQQLVDEHLAAFMYNNAIIRSFNIPWWAAAHGAVAIMPRKIQLVLLAIVGAIVALFLAAMWR